MGNKAVCNSEKTKGSAEIEKDKLTLPVTGCMALVRLVKKLKDPRATRERSINIPFLFYFCTQIFASELCESD